MKTLKSVFLLVIAILLSGCYTQLQYQQTADKRSSGQEASSYEQERTAGEYAAVKESARKQVRQVDYDRRARVGYYYVGGDRPNYPYYYQDDYFYGGYFGPSWLSYEHYVNWSPSYYRYHSGFHPYFARWQWGSYFRYAHMPYSGPWFSVSFGYGKYYPYYRWHDMYAFHPWGYGYGYGWNNYYYNNYYFLDDDYAWYDDDRARNTRYGLRSTGTSRLGVNGGVRGDGTSVRTRGALNSGSSSATRIRGGSSGTTRSTGNVKRTRSGGTSRSGSTGSTGNTRKRGGNDQGVQDEGQDKREDVQRTRTVYIGATNFRTLPETSRSTDLYSEENRMQRVRPMYTSGNDISWNTRSMQERLKDQRVEPMEMRPTVRNRGGFLQKLGRFFESSRSSYDHIWDRQGDRGGVDRDRDRDRGTVNRGSTGSDTRSRSGSSGSRSRGSGGGDDDGSSRSRGGGN